MESNNQNQPAPDTKPTPPPSTIEKQPTPASVSPVQRHTKRSLPLHYVMLGTAAALLIIVAAVAFLAKETTPGDPLYTAKINIYERAVATTKFTGEAKVAYEASRIDSRFTELQTIARESGTTSPEVVEQVGALIERHANDAVTALNSSTLSLEDQITLLAEIGTTLRAASILIDDTEELASSTDGVETARESVASALSTGVATFTTSGATSTIEAFLSKRINVLGESIVKVAPGSEAQRLAITRITDASEAVADGDLKFALNAILRAEEAIAVDGYLYASERGEGPLPEATEPVTTEGQ